MKSPRRSAAPTLIASLLALGLLTGCAPDPAEKCPLDAAAWSDATGREGGRLTYNELGDTPDCGYRLGEDDEEQFGVYWKPTRPFAEEVSYLNADDVIALDERYPDRIRSVGGFGNLFHVSYLLNVDGIGVHVTYSGPAAVPVSPGSTKVRAAFEILDAVIEAAEANNWKGVRP